MTITGAGPLAGHCTPAGLRYLRDRHARLIDNQRQLRTAGIELHPRSAADLAWLTAHIADVDLDCTRCGARVTVPVPVVDQDETTPLAAICAACDTDATFDTIARNGAL